MRNRYIRLALVVVVLICSCNGTVKNNSRLKLRNDEILDLIERLNPNQDTTLNIHLSYNDYLNDSCVVLTVVQNRYDPSDKKNIQSQMKFKKIDVFVHKDHEDKAFYVPDSGLGLILWQRSNGTNIFYKMDPLPRYDSKLNNEFDELIPAD
jgi:hypothetical protein